MSLGTLRKPVFRRTTPTAACGLIAALLLWIAGCTKPLTETEEGGKALYEIHCFACHEENQSGLRKVPPKLHDIFSRRYLPDGTTPATDVAVREVIIYGKRTMPAFNGRLSQAQIVDLIAYLHRK